jgi:DNA-binding protein YbaB
MTRPFGSSPFGPDDQMDRLQHTIEDLPRQVTELTERVNRAAAQTVTGEDASGQVVATVTGRGEIQSVRVSLRALRESDNRTLGRQVLAAVNAGLDRADALLADIRPDSPESDVDDAMRRYEQRMDDLLYRLDDISRSLDRLDD